MGMRLAATVFPFLSRRPAAPDSQLLGKMALQPSRQALCLSCNLPFGDGEHVPGKERTQGRGARGEGSLLYAVPKERELPGGRFQWIREPKTLKWSDSLSFVTTTRLSRYYDHDEGKVHVANDCNDVYHQRTAPK